VAWLDDRIYAHPKIRNVPRATRWSYAAALAYASGFGTAGVLTEGQLKAIEATKRDRELLIEVGLWDDAGRGAIRIHDWKDHNGKRDARREADRLRKRAERAKNEETSAGHNTDKLRTANAVSAGQSVDRPRAPARRRPPDDGSDRVTEEGLATDSAAGVQSTSGSLEARSAETEDLQTSAAAVESPTEQDIRDACKRFGADSKIVEPIARQLPGAIFAAVVTKHAAKVKRGSVDDVPALFVTLLKAELKDQARAAAKHAQPMPPTRLPEGERPTKVEGEDWVRHIVPTLKRHPFERVADLVAERAAAEHWTDEQLNDRLGLALELHQADAA